MLRPMLVVVALAVATVALAQVNQPALDDVAAGKLKEAKASWWGFDATDATACLQAAIDSKVPKLTVDNVGKPWIVTPIRLVGNQEITFEKGVEVLAKADEFKGTGDTLFTASLIENVVLNGYGATLRMRRADYDDPARYKRGEWRHVVQLRSCTNVKILGLTLAESGGDGIYLGTGQRGVTNKDIVIRDVVCDKNYRQGISVITAENLLIENTVMSNTDGTAPRAGIDFEPNHPEERIVNCVMRNCRSEGNAGAGYVAYLAPLDATSLPVSLRLENCTASGNASLAFGIITGNTPARALKGQCEIVDCTFEGGGGPGLVFGGNPATGIQMLVRNTRLLDVAPKSPAVRPIVFDAAQDATQDVGGVKFEDCLIRDALGRKPLGFSDNSGNLRVAGVTGNLILEKDGVKTPVTITEQVLGEWMPAINFKRYPRLKLAADLKPLTPGGTPDKFGFGELRWRVKAHFVLYAKQGDDVTMRFYHGQVGKYSGTTLPVTVTDWSGQTVATGGVDFQKEGDVTFKAPATGAYRVEVVPGSNYARLVSTTHLLNLTSESEAIHLISTGRQFYFYIPAGTKEFGVKLFGEGTGEGIKATLTDAAGKQVDMRDDITQAQQFEVTLPAPSPGEIWGLKTEHAATAFLEDNYVQLLGIPPLLAPSPEAVLKAAP